MNVLSLFSGIGGLELGLERAGMTVVGQVEIDPWCRKVLAKHWPEVPRHDDVRTCVDWWRAEPRPAVDLVCGGFPCQGHSVAGLRRGIGDERWGWPWYREVVQAVNPPWVLIENVPNLVGTGLVDVLRDLAGLGFDVWWGCVPAAAVGAPHLRWRLFVVAAHPERVELRHQPGWLSGADGTGPADVGHDGTTWALAHAEGLSGELWPATRQRPGRPAGRSRPLNVASADRTGRRQRRRAVAVSASQPPVECRREGMANTYGQSPGGSSVPWPERDHWATEPDVGRVAHGVPGRVDRLRGLGNAVVPQVAEYVGRLIIDAETGAAA